MTLTLYGIPNCDTVKRARSWLDERGVGHQFHDYKKAGIDAATLDRWADGLGWGMIVNRAGTTFRKLSDADKAALEQASEDRDGAIGVLIANPSVIKRPVLEGTGTLLAGFKPEIWQEALT